MRCSVCEKEATVRYKSDKINVIWILCDSVLCLNKAKEVEDGEETKDISA